MTVGMRLGRPGTARRSAAEGVAARRIAGLEARVEPVRPLVRRAVGPGLRVDPNACARLDPVVAHRRRCLQALLDVARVEIALLVDRLGPHARQAVRLELELDGQLVLAARVLLLELADLGLDARELL